MEWYVTHLNKLSAIQEDMETAVINLHSIFESLRGQAYVLNDSIEPRKYLLWFENFK